jgi:hypothetical protein
VMFSVRCRAGLGNTPGSVTLIDGDGRTLYRQDLTFIAPDGDLGGVAWDGRSYGGKDGKRVILMAPGFDGSAHRRWALLRTLERNPLSAGRRIVLWGAGGNRPDDLADLRQRLGGMLPGKELVAADYAGDAHAAALVADRMADGDGMSVVCIAWGGEESYQRDSPVEFRNALIFAAYRIQCLHPSARAMLVTPSPLIGEIKLSERCAQAVRTAAHEADLTLVDWHARIRARVDWESYFLIDGDPAVSGRFPNADGRGLLASAIAEVLR